MSDKYVNKLRIFLNVENQDELLLEIVDITKEKVLSYLNVDEIPSKLDWIIIELSVIRFNKIGSEGLKSESSDGVANTYLEDDLDKYKPFLDEYIKENSLKSKGYKLF